MLNKIETYVGGETWNFSDKIYTKLTQTPIYSEFNPILPVTIMEFPPFISHKQVFGMFWGSPTFKDVDANYLLHAYDRSLRLSGVKNKPPLILSPSSGNTVEGVARSLWKYNNETEKQVMGLLLVPELSSYKVSSIAIQGNPYVLYLVLKNASLDSTRDFAKQLSAHLAKTFTILVASEDLKTAAYAQIGRVLADAHLMDENTCYVQTVSGGMGPAGLIESAEELKVRPEIVVVQPENGTPGPIVDAIFAHARGDDPLIFLQKGNYKTSTIEPTLGSTKPIYAIQKLLKWTESGGKLLGATVTDAYLMQNFVLILNLLLSLGIYPNSNIGRIFFSIEKSGFIAIAGALQVAQKIQAHRVVINFTGRRPMPRIQEAGIVAATPHLVVDPRLQDLGEIVDKVRKMLS